MSKPNLPIDLNSVLKTTPDKSLNTKQLFFFTIVFIVIFIGLKFYLRYQEKNKLTNYITSLQVGDRVMINSISSIIEKIDYHYVYIKPIEGEGYIKIKKEDIKTLKIL